MNVLITGSSQGIGRAASEKFLQLGHTVFGIDREKPSISHPNYHHFQCDLRDKTKYPKIEKIDYVFLNAGTQNSGSDIENNLKATMDAAEEYATLPGVKAVLFSASASARTGFEFPEYVASKAGAVGYMKNLACRLAKYGTVVNAISFGGVLTSSNQAVMNDPECWEKIMAVTPLKKWTSLEEAAEWIYFLLAINTSMSGQDILVDNGETNLNNTFVWPE